jgi:peptidoglycan/LPS O-acetylase OafA/YrhL
MEPESSASQMPASAALPEAICPPPSCPDSPRRDPERGDRYAHLDAARALAAVLVVAQHVAQFFQSRSFDHFSSSFGQGLYDSVIFLHIPTFMLIAGCVQSFKPEGLGTRGGYWRFVGGKFRRLMLPFVAVTLLQAACRLAAARGEIQPIRADVFYSLVAPNHGLAGHLWFLYSLMCIFLLWPLLAWAARKLGWPLLTGAALVLAILPIPWPMPWGRAVGSLFALRRTAWFLPIFVLGYHLGRSGRLVRRPHPIEAILVAAVLAAAMLVRFLVHWPEGLLWETALRAILLCGRLAGAMTMVYLCRFLCDASHRVAGALQWLGLRSYDVYLLHVLVGGPLVLAMSWLNPGPLWTYVLFVLAIAIACSVAIALGGMLRRWRLPTMLVLGGRLAKKRASGPA